MEHVNTYKDANGLQHALQKNMAVTFSPKSAKKDKSDRERMIEKARNLLSKQELIASTNKRGGRKYIDRTNKDKPEYALAESKIGQNSRFDRHSGFYPE